MFRTKPPAYCKKTLQALYHAIREDDPTALEHVVNTDNVDVNKLIRVRLRDDQPYTADMRGVYATADKTLMQLAVDMGHGQCLAWLVQHGADITPFLRITTEDLSQKRHDMDVYADAKSNYVFAGNVLHLAIANHKGEAIRIANRAP